MRSFAALVPAAGRGRRLGAGRNKVFLDLGGLPILAHTLLRLQAAEPFGLAEIVVALGRGETEAFDRSVRPHLKARPAIRLVTGGADRQSSVYRALQEVTSGEGVLVHDAARPLVPVPLIARCLEAAGRLGCVAAALPVSDTIKETDESGRIRRTLPRAGLWRAQTPQVFPRQLLRDAHARARSEGYTGTDDAALIERLGETVHIVPGDERNVKITTEADLLIAAALLKIDGERHV